MSRTRILGVAAAAAALSAAACSGTHAGASPAERAPVVTGETVTLPTGSPMLSKLRSAPVAMAELPADEIVAPGKIEANPNRVSKVVLPVTGRITAVYVKVGDAVRKDQPLLSIQSPDADAAMSAYLTARAALTQAEAAATKAQTDYDRSADLFEHQATAKKEVLADQNALAQAKAAVEQARASREQAERRLAVLGLEPGSFEQEVVVRAPLAGKVLELAAVPGEFRNDANASVVTVADLSTVWVTSQVPESDIRFVQVGERVEIDLVAYPGETFDGRVSRIADTVDPQTRTVKVQAQMENRDGRLRPEMYGSIHHIESTERLPVVPVGAVVQSGSMPVVFVETSPGTFEERQVTVGKRAGDVVRVPRGVAAGEQVVVDGAMLLEGLVRQGART